MLDTGTGWVPDVVDPRDAVPQTPRISQILERAFKEKAHQRPDGMPAMESLPSQVDLRSHFPPVYDQAQTNSCTANALSGLVAYFERRTFGSVTEPSRLFIYKTTRNLIHADRVDAGAYLRSALEALTIFGTPPESFWPFDMAILPVEPPAFLYAFANRFSAIERYRYDPPDLDKSAVLHRVKANLSAGLPAAFGFYLFKSIVAAQAGGNIPYPAQGEASIGGHAVVAAGYDDTRIIRHPQTGSETTGAILLRNSWGNGWGDGGYGWLPYEYVIGGLAIDWWSILKMDWFDLNNPLFEIDGGSTN